MASKNCYIRPLPHFPELLTPRPWAIRQKAPELLTPRYKISDVRYNVTHVVKPVKKM